ncbi:ABC transporter ATP-binding protein [Pontibacillus yanchengensis]|uniref:Antibiotic ABC transporter ATP-binding protein n=1 Tax=Pontibacillus yanchengensis Y32 TaxID=1385514 RepID=A0A0A2TGD4_9BACI|nr:ABC transporter ATP-binding protein [Pontibacillus yanchengensis]KGP73478.1 antibiotic ABC transporter ATP-binding protein [Pontibacillus yanchengensis Y32]
MFLEIRDLHKKFHKHCAVQNVNLSIDKGEVLGLLGPNGAGKSTTISMISTLLLPTDGDILFKETSVVEKPQQIRDILGYVPQEIALYPEFTALENLHFFAKMYKVPRKNRVDRIQEVLQLVGLTDRATEKIETYSGGMKRRLNIACALVHKPELLILDEPTVGIDPQSRNHILQMVKQLSKDGMTIIYTSHYMEEVEFLCDRIAIMDNGEIIALGTKEALTNVVEQQDVMTIRAIPVKTTFKEQIEQLEDVTYVNCKDNSYDIGIKQGADLLPEVFTIAQNLEVRILHVEVKTPRLEDVFLYLTGKTLRDA